MDMYIWNLVKLWSCTSPLSKQLLHLQVSSNILQLKAHPSSAIFSRNCCIIFCREGCGGLRWPLPGEKTSLGNRPLTLPPLKKDMLKKVICFRSSCRRGRCSSSSLPGFVREDIYFVNTVPVVCFAGSGETNLPVLGYRDFSPTILKESPVFCSEVKKAERMRWAVIHHSWQLFWMVSRPGLQ